MIANGIHVRITLVEDQGDGELFFADVRSMIQNIAHRFGGECRPVIQEPSSPEDLSETYACDFSTGLPAVLLRECGAHRAQLVPADSAIGRVVSSRVVVAITPTNEPVDRGRVVKTYNYVQRRVTRHESGEVLRLEDVLAGRA